MGDWIVLLLLFTIATEVSTAVGHNVEDEKQLSQHSLLFNVYGEFILN